MLFRVFCASETRPWRDLAIKLKELFPEYPNVEDLDVDTGIETQMDTSLLQVRAFKSKAKARVSSAQAED
jgi:hypothetical protein